MLAGKSRDSSPDVDIWMRTSMQLWMFDVRDKQRFHPFSGGVAGGEPHPDEQRGSASGSQPRGRAIDGTGLFAEATGSRYSISHESFFRSVRPAAAIGVVRMLFLPPSALLLLRPSVRRRQGRNDQENGNTH